MVEKKAAKNASSSGSSVVQTKSQEGRGRSKIREGVVVSNKMQKTVVVAVERQVKHATYGKYIRKTSRYYAHDESGACNIGDKVRIKETRPMSKLKRWKVAEVLTKAELVA